MTSRSRREFLMAALGITAAGSVAAAAGDDNIAADDLNRLFEGSKRWRSDGRGVRERFSVHLPAGPLDEDCYLRIGRRTLRFPKGVETESVAWLQEYRAGPGYHLVDSSVWRSTNGEGICRLDYEGTRDEPLIVSTAADDDLINVSDFLKADLLGWNEKSPG